MADALRDAQPKTVEEAGSGSRSYSAPTRVPGRKDAEERRESVSPEDDDERREGADALAHLASLPEIPTVADDLKFDFGSFEFMAPSTEVEKKVHKRASNVLKLTQENEKLQAQLKAMAEQLEAMERMRAQLVAKEQKAVEKKS